MSSLKSDNNETSFPRYCSRIFRHDFSLDKLREGYLYENSLNSRLTISSEAYHNPLSIVQAEVEYLQFATIEFKTVEKALSVCDDKIDNKIF